MQELPTGASTILIIFPLLFAALAWAGAIYALRRAVKAEAYAKSCYDWIEANNARSRTLKQLSELEAELTDQRDGIQSIHASLNKLRSRIGMRERRAALKAADDLPDSRTDPAGYKREMRKRLNLVKGPTDAD